MMVCRHVCANLGLEAFPCSTESLEGFILNAREWKHKKLVTTTDL